MEAIAIVVVAVLAFLVFVGINSAKNREKLTESKQRLFVQMMKDKYPDFATALNENSARLFLHEWSVRRHDEYVLSETRLIAGVKRGQMSAIGGFKSSLEEMRAAEYILKECVGFVSNSFKESLLSSDTTGSIRNSVYEAQPMRV